MTADMDLEESAISVIIKRGISPLIQVEVEPAGSWYHQYEHCRLHGGSGEDKITLIQVEVEPAGSWYHQYEHCRLHGGSGEDKISESDNSDDSKDRDRKEVVIEDDITFLRSLDPVKWKEQDHYKVLGLHTYRYRAKDEDIKKAHRQMVLRHHPDKRRGAGEEVRDGDDYFTNITKAYEMLGDPIKRRAYDSVDPEFDDKVPGDKLNNKDFFELFAPAFERNARWSLRKHVPQLGQDEDTKEKVDAFYDFWYNFDSWREFSYLDEEDKEKGEDRDERRWIEKQNKAERAVRRKEENARIRKMVDNAYKLDPRVARFRDEEREKKASVKRARQDAARQREVQEHQERIRAEEEEKLRKEKEETDLRNRIANEKKEREGIKKVLKKDRKTMRTMCKEADYFITEEKDRVQAMMDVETLCDSLQLLQLKDLISRVDKSKDNKEETRKIIKQEVTDLRSGKLENINIVNISLGSSSNHNVNRSKPATTTNSNNNNGSCSNSTPLTPKEKVWSAEELQLLIKAVNLFPAGTAKRWDVVSQYLSQHGPNKVTRPSKEVLNKAKELQNCDTSALLKEAANKNAVAQLTAEGLKAGAGIPVMEASERMETPQEMLGINLTPWSAEEQSRLEQALKSFPASTEDRWGKIAETIPGRNKKDCMRRYKELAEMIRAKKAAMQAAGVKK